MATYTPPASIDRTGHTPVAMLLNEWLNGHYTFQGGVMHPDGGDSRWAGDAGQYPPGSGGLPDGSTIQWPTNTVYNIDDYMLQFTGEMLSGGNVFPNGRIRRNMHWIQPDTCWFIRSDARLDGGPGTPQQLCEMVHFEELEYLIVDGLNIRGVKPQWYPYAGWAADYESPSRNAFGGVSMRRYEILNAKILSPLTDCMLITSRGSDKLIFFSCVNGSDIINITGENARRFDADDVGRVLLTGGNQAYDEQANWTFDNGGDSKNRYGAPTSSKADRTTTAFPVLAKTATYVEWPRIIQVLSPTQARISMPAVVTRSGIGTGQRAHITIRIGPGGTTGWDSCFGGNIHDNYLWDAGRNLFTIKAHVPDGGTIENVANIVPYVANRHADIGSNDGRYAGQASIDSIEDSFGNSMPNPTNTPGGNSFENTKNTNTVENRPPGGPYNGKNNLAYPNVAIGSATPVPWLSKIPSLTAYPIDWSDQSRILFKGAGPTAPTSMTGTTARFEFTMTKRPVYILLAVSKRKVGTGLGTAPGDDYHTYAGAVDNLATNHCNVTATGLSPSTTYHFVITVTGSAGAGDVSDTPASRTFTTPAGGGGGVPAPTISGFAVSGVPTGTSVTLHFTTNTPGNTVIMHRIRGSTGPFATTTSNTQTSNHTITITGLVPDTEYEFFAGSENADGNAALVPSGPVYAITDDVSAAGPFAYGGAAIMTADTTNTTVRVVFSTTGGPFDLGYGSTTVAFAVVGSSTTTVFVDDPTLMNVHDVTITGLTPGVQYVITVSSEGADGTQLGPVFLGPVTTLTTGTPSLVFGGFAVDWLTNTSCRFSWTTDRRSTSQVSYGLLTTALDPTLALNHSVLVTGLPPATTIGALARGRDATGVESISVTAATFTTLPAPAPNPTPVVERFNTTFTTLPALSSAFGTGTDDFIGPTAVAGQAHWEGQLTTGATRKAYWPVGVAALLNGEVRSRWTARSGIEVQHGHVHRLTGAGPFQFVTITRNIFGGTTQQHNVNAHYWITDRVDPITSLSAPFVQFSGFPVPHLLNIDLPWNVKSRTIGPYLDFAAWLDVDTEPAYSNAVFGARFEIPPASTCRSTAGVHGFYMGHNLPGTTSDVDNFIVNELGAGGTVGLPGIQPGSIRIVPGSITATSATFAWTTAELSDSLVLVYGAPAQVRNPALVTDHLFTAVGLTPATSYTAWVRSENSAGIETV